MELIIRILLSPDESKRECLRLGLPPLIREKVEDGHVNRKERKGLDKHKLNALPRRYLQSEVYPLKLETHFYESLKVAMPFCNMYTKQTANLTSGSLD